MAGNGKHVQPYQEILLEERFYLKMLSVVTMKSDSDELQNLIVSLLLQ
jgi:hypothetical protein